MIALEVIANHERLREFEPEWLNFARRVPAETPFQRPEWLIAWWAYFGSGEMRVMVFRENGRIAGVLPLFLHDWNGRRQLTLIGSGISDDLDPLFMPEYANDIVDRIARELHGWQDWDVCEWQDLSAETPLKPLGTAAADTPCGFLPINGPFENYLNSRPKDLRRNLHRYKQKAEAIAPVTFEAVNTADDELLNALIELHRARWERSDESGMIEANRSEPFLRAVVPLLASRGLMTFFAVRFDERVAAVLLALRNETAIFSYLSAFDPEHEAFGFGRELLAQAIRYAHESGCKTWNFLRGAEPYKFSWGAQPIEKCRVVISR